MATRKKLPKTDDAEKCGNCRHFGEDDGQKVCRRYPRQFVMDAGSVSMCYPPHFVADVCGEFSRRLQA